MGSLYSNFKVSIIIPNYNGLNLLRNNLPKVLKAFHSSRNQISQIIVVDDGSTDESVKYIKTLPEITLIKHKINRGFIASVNTGARGAVGDLLALLNTDVIVSQNFLESTLKIFSDPKVFAVSFHERGFGWAKGYYKDGFIVHDSGTEDEKIHDTFWVNGGSGIFRRDYWMKLGGMDEALLSPFYWEDVDISYRALKRGWKIYWDPDSLVIHEHESSIKKINKSFRQRIQERNQLLFIWKNLTSGNLMSKHLSGLILRVSKHPRYLIIILMALRKIRLVVKARRKEIKEAKISDEAILSKF